MADVSAALAPNSQQLDNIELRGRGHVIFTVTGVDVRAPGSDQPIVVHLAEFDRPWKPGKTMGRVLAHCWGRESDNWPGERVELYSDEKVKFGNDTPGGTRISRISGIDEPQQVPVLLSQGKPGFYKVDPLPADEQPTTQPTEPTAKQVAACTDVAQLRAWWKVASPERRAQIEQRKDDLENEPTPGGDAA